MKAVALVVAAGRGERLGAPIPKALIPLAGRPLLRHALDALEAASSIEAVVVATPPGDERVGEVARSSPLVVAVVEGGASRQASVLAALEASPEAEVTVCHDAARPLASAALVDLVVGAIGPADGAVPVLPDHDTVKRVDGEVVLETVPRSELVLAQTPQAFRRDALVAAHRRAAEDGIGATDDAALLELAGFKVVTVPGEPQNLKITTATDLRLAAELVRG